MIFIDSSDGLKVSLDDGWLCGFPSIPHSVWTVSSACVGCAVVQESGRLRMVGHS